nr:MAG TPA: CAAD domains of cyanobacterial aminoacyl-tRNA synthetase [Caudoviricetes sp.]
MKKTILKVMLLNILALPCMLTFNDVNPITGDWNYTMNLVGIIYSIWFYHNVLKKAFRI